MQVKDKQYVANIFNRISKSVTNVNEKIMAQRLGKVTVDDVLATAALEQLAMQHEMLIVLAMLIFDPGTGSQELPELPKKIVGFN
jgi:hypothetical protein